MKKNKMMRIAAVLLIVTLLSTCAISGTFAKYVAKADYEDSARVAKWGIKIETGGELFSDSYVADDEDYIAANGEGALSVKSDNGDKVVAPGTSGTDSFYAKISGKPEVATRFSLSLTGLQDIYMPYANGYTDYSVGVKKVDGQEVAQTFDLQPIGDYGTNNSYISGYSPVKWDVTVSRVKADGSLGRDLTLSTVANEVASGMGLGNLAEALFSPEGVSMTDAKTIVSEVKRRGLESTLMDYLNTEFANHGFSNLKVEITDDDIILSMDFAPGEDCNYLFTGGWAWAFEQSAPSFVPDAQSGAYTDLFNKADTYIGNVAAGIIDDDTVSTDLTFNLVASATQID